jgi:hypothetical protein
MARREGLKACFQINPRPSGSKPVANPIRNGEIQLTSGTGRNRAARSGTWDSPDGPIRPPLMKMKMKIPNSLFVIALSTVSRQQNTASTIQNESNWGPTGSGPEI